MSIPAVDVPAPLLEALRLEYGPRDMLHRYFVETTARLEAGGIAVTISRDASRPKTLAARDAAAPPIAFPAMDANSAGFGPDSWFALEGRDGNARLAFFGAGRLLRLRGSLKDEIESLRLLYCDPAAQRQADDSAEVTAPTVAAVTGFVALLGSYWVAPGFRGRGLARIFPSLCRFYACAVWPIDFEVGFLRANQAKHLARAYNEPPPERWVKFRGRWSDDSYICCNPRAGIESGLYAATAGVKSRATLIAVSDDSSRLPSVVRQGRTSR